MIHINYNKRNINIISFIISLIIFILIVYILHSLNQNNLNQFRYINVTLENDASIKVKNEMTNEKNAEIKQDKELNEIEKWRISIEKLNISAEIKEGTYEDILKENIGHMEKTNILNGIVVLKAYNTGQKINYFANLKELIIGDEIKYVVNEEERIYKVVENIILNEENLEEKIQNLKEEKENNILILLTYVKDMEGKNRLVISEEK